MSAKGSSQYHNVILNERTKAETHEDNDLVNAVDELWGKVASNSAHHQLSGLLFDNPFAHVVKINCSQVTGHDNDRITEVHNTALPVG